MKVRIKFYKERLVRKGRWSLFFSNNYFNSLLLLWDCYSSKFFIRLYLRVKFWFLLPRMINVAIYEGKKNGYFKIVDGWIIFNEKKERRYFDI